MEIARDLLFKIVLLVVLVALFFVFIDQASGLMTKAKEEYISSPVQEKEEVVESQFKSLGISPYDSPKTVIYKLFRSFDPSFLNEKSGSSIMYYPFILDLKEIEYLNIYNNDLIDMIREGIRNFNEVDNTYQIGDDNQQPPICDNPQYDGNINYNNDCWTTALDTDLTNMDTNPPTGNPCKILVHGDAFSRFNHRIKIRIGWYEGGTSSTDRQIVYTLITMCDG